MQNLCELKLHTETGKKFHKNTIFIENLYALTEEGVIPYQINKKKSSPSQISLKIGTHVGFIGKLHQTKI